MLIKNISILFELHNQNEFSKVILPPLHKIRCFGKLKQFAKMSYIVERREYITDVAIDLTTEYKQKTVQDELCKM